MAVIQNPGQGPADRKNSPGCNFMIFKYCDLVETVRCIYTQLDIDSEIWVKVGES